MKTGRANVAIMLLFVLSVSSLSGCEGVVGNKVKNTGVYYDLVSLLDHQVVLLDALQPTVEKITVIDGNREVKAVQLDSAGWVRELEIFYGADINEPVLRDAYVREEGIAGDSLNVITYRALDSQKVKIDCLSVFYHHGEDSPAYVKALYKENNALYEAERILKLSFDDLQDPPVLRTYSIEGTQKMLMKDTISYKVEAKIVF